ncbi:olfactory receptor-like protein DTMT [Erpetoichthys calabaricus]|uniref:olfactory receptor-like protein DTMT n=1 Tax=Erpetoichthys calabaricus TaxID=27687 RepID=UPI0022344B40|nr:olfactory receptor-like protein DTMT [Erpetoichthys calabaricus]
MMWNVTVMVSEFILQCAIDPDQKTIITVSLALIYLTTLIGNLLVIVVITIDLHLHTPMFWYICCLAIIDIANSSNLIPRMLGILLFNSSIVPYGPCLLQLSMVGYLGVLEGNLLLVMACDRYVAVVYPLRYPLIVTSKVVWSSIFLVNIIGVVIVTPYMVYVRELSFCRTNVLPFCFCDYATMVQIACTDDPKYIVILSITTGISASYCVTLTVFSYYKIARAALKISSVKGKQKVFSTLLTHLLVVGLFYFPLMISYILPGVGVKLSTEACTSLIIVAILVPPMMNPLIYSFRNKEIKSSIRRLFTGMRTNPEIEDP